MVTVVLREVATSPIPWETASQEAATGSRGRGVKVGGHQLSVLKRRVGHLTHQVTQLVKSSLSLHFFVVVVAFFASTLFFRKLLIWVISACFVVCVFVVFLVIWAFILLVHDFSFLYFGVHTSNMFIVKSVWLAGHAWQEHWTFIWCVCMSMGVCIHVCARTCMCEYVFVCVCIHI